MKRYFIISFAPITLLCVALSVAAEDTNKIYFDNIKDKSIYVEVISDKVGNKALRTVGAVLTPQSQKYIDLLDEGYLSGFLSPDRSRILVSLGHIDEKNLWVVNLRKSRIEFESHENLGRHLFPKWLNTSSFELMYGGMGYRVERHYKLDGDTWKLIRDKTFTDQ